LSPFVLFSFQQHVLRLQDTIWKNVRRLQTVVARMELATVAEVKTSPSVATAPRFARASSSSSAPSSLPEIIRVVKTQHRKLVQLNGSFSSSTSTSDSSSSSSSSSSKFDDEYKSYLALCSDYRKLIVERPAQPTKDFSTAQGRMKKDRETRRAALIERVQQEIKQLQVSVQLLQEKAALIQNVVDVVRLHKASLPSGLSSPPPHFFRFGFNSFLFSFRCRGNCS